jgi:hypothetical protein
LPSDEISVEGIAKVPTGPKILSKSVLKMEWRMNRSLQ